LELIEIAYEEEYEVISIERRSTWIAKEVPFRFSTTAAFTKRVPSCIESYQRATSDRNSTVLTTTRRI